ncbi:unnamed protein product [Calypogeia fissa]
MGSQVSTIKAVIDRDRKKKGAKAEKAKIGILSFEVANVMSKIMLLWQSLSEQEILRLRTDVIKAEGVLNLVSDNEAVLLSLACMEKLQDLTAVAGAVARLGKKCQEPLLQGFEHVYNDVLKHKVDVHKWEFALKDMEAKVKKMEQFIASTSNLYQELEILGDLEIAIRRMQDDGSGTPRDRETLIALEEKALWHRQEIKYLRDLSLWNRTYDKVVSLLARTVCTIHGRIIAVFGSPLLGLPQLFPVERLRDAQASLLKTGSSPFIKLTPLPHQRRVLERQSSIGPVVVGPFTPGSPHDRTFVNGAITNSVSSSYVSRVSPVVSDMRPALSSGPIISQSRKPNACYFPLYQTCLQSPTRGSMDFQALAIDSPYDNPASLSSSKVGAGAPWSNFSETLSPASLRSSQPFPHRTPFRLPSVSPNHDLFSQTGHTRKVFFDPKHRHHNAPSTTLGGAALALHYANVIIIIEKMIKFPHLISHDSRDDLYNMLPKSVRMALRSRLKAGVRKEDGFDADIARDWKEALERILAWLTPLAHNMIRWQSEHNFEQQQVVARSNILLLQTLYFADLAKSEAAITELLVGLNYICGHEKEKINATPADYDSQKEVEDYLEWQF